MGNLGDMSNEQSTVAGRLAPLTAILTASCGPRLRTVTAWGEWLSEPGDRRLPAHALVVIDGLDPAQLRHDAAEVWKLARLGLDPTFFDLPAFRQSFDVFPLEYLAMQAEYEVVAGEDLLAQVTFPPAALRLQIEEELRSLRCGLHQELAREGHRPQVLRRVIAERFVALETVWRGLLNLAGQTAPAAQLPLLAAATQQYELDAGQLDALRGVAEGTLRPEFDELGRLADGLDRLLATLTDRVDVLDGQVT